MSDATLGRAAPAHDATQARPAALFLGLLLAVSVLPFAVFALIFPVGGATLSVFQMLMLANTPHVAMTAIFVIDARYRGHMAGDPRRYILIPLAIVAVAVGAAALFGTAGAIAVLMVNAAWLMHHYGRQNWGILCLAAIGTRSGKPLAAERFALTWAPIAAMLGSVPAMAYVPPGWTSGGLPDWALAGAGALYYAGMAVTAAAVAAWLVAAAQLIARGASPLRVGLSAVGALFFLPLFILADPGVALLASVTAHALQYMVMTGALALDDQRQSLLWRLGLLVPAVALVTWGITALMASTSPVVACLLVGLIAGFHFWLDAGVWRLREPFQRAALQESYRFLFR